MNAITVNANYAEPHNNLGNTYKEINQLDLAIASYEKSLEVNPNFAFANFNLGLIYQNRNELLKALNPIVKEYMVEKKIIMILNKKDILLADEKLNITSDIMKLINNKLK